MRHLLISDLHLSENSTLQNRAFVQLLDGYGREHDEILILGDLFDLWIGDDDDSPWLDELLDAMQRCAASGVRLGVQHGNHDFLLGEGFAQRSSARLLDEYLLMPLGGQSALLMHGDQLCTLDTGYQEFRAEVRGAQWQKQFCAHPLHERRQIASKLRRDSRGMTSRKSTEIMDVTPDEVVRVMQHYRTRLLVHGHTHRPAVHELTVDGEAARRMVLGSWENGCGWRIEASATSAELVRFPLS